MNITTLDTFNTQQILKVGATDYRIFSLAAAEKTLGTGIRRMPITQRVHMGGSFTREELSRDDSMIQYLELNKLYGVTMGKKDRDMIVRGFIDVGRFVNVSVFWMDVSNPYHWVSGSWPVSGPTAYTGRSQDRAGVTLTVRTP